jgi:dTDP-4-dehydrorhamnose reductase
MITPYSDFFKSIAEPKIPDGVLEVWRTLPEGRGRILITGGNGNLARSLIRVADEMGHEVVAPPKDEVNITISDQWGSSIEGAVDYVNPDYVIHAAARTKPMSAHEKTPLISMNTNIVGTCNVVKACMDHGAKLIYISTDYVYEGTEGNYHEDDPVKPFNKYGWTKLGGECAVRMYDNSLILRLSITKRPFQYPKAFGDAHKSFMFADEAAKAILEVIDENGVINVGGPRKTVYDFAVESGADVEMISINDIEDVTLAVDTSMNIDRLNGLREENSTCSR